MNPMIILNIILFGPLLVYGLGYGLAWYWSELMGQAPTENLTNFSIAVVAFFVAIDYVFLGINKYVARTVGDANRKKPFGLKDKLYGLLIIIVVAIGWMVLEIVRAT